MASWHHNSSDETIEDLTFSLIEKITHKFSQEVKVGSGGFGEVYWGVYRDKKIAVKKLYDNHQRFDDEAFKKEFNNCMKLRHKNIVRLVGYCFEIRHKHIEKNGEYEFGKWVERVLCFEYCQGGSLDKYIYEEFREHDMDTRLRIIRGITEGLDHLHNGQGKQHMYHLDLKPENILLDESNMPKIADFGLSRFLAISKTHITSTSTGTTGYMPPEYIEGKISSKFDVFSLGVIILQVLAVPLGYSKCDDDMTPREFVEHVHKNWNERSPPVMASSELYRVKEYINIALRCVEKEREKRPKIRDILIQLKYIDAQYSVGPPRSRGWQNQIKDLAMDPASQLRFPFELSKEIPCCLQVTNNTDCYIAFNIKMDQKKYHAHPNKSTVQPGSFCNIVITTRAWNTVPLSTDCGSILVQSTRVGGYLSPDEISDKMFDRSTGNAVDQVELPVVYVPIHQRPIFQSN